MHTTTRSIVRGAFRMKRILLLPALAALLAFPGAIAGCGEDGVSPLQAQGRLRVAATTSLYDTGLWGYLEPQFEDKYDVELDVLNAGTGKALEWGTRGDVDVITVHSKAREEQFVADGYGLERVPFAYNYFLVVGSASDPARIGALRPEEAFAKMMEAGQSNPDVKFVSRGDDSGTHGKEKAIWAAAEYDYEEVRTSGGWYIEGGSGMGPTLVMANEKGAYTLSDIGTFLAYQGDLDLVPVVDEGDVLLNVYSVIATTSTKQPEMAQNLVDFLTSGETQKLIGEYGTEEYGRQLFTPCAGEDL
jgi:tungstate transport system substrate-binding protein